MRTEINSEKGRTMSKSVTVDMPQYVKSAEATMPIAALSRLKTDGASRTDLLSQNALLGTVGRQGGMTLPTDFEDEDEDGAGSDEEAVGSEEVSDIEGGGIEDEVDSDVGVGDEDDDDKDDDIVADEHTVSDVESISDGEEDEEEAGDFDAR
jgi:hypothetical protein